MFNRVYFVNGKFDLGDGQAVKVGGETILSVDYDPADGLLLRTERYEAFIPGHTIKASWRRA